MNTKNLKRTNYLSLSDGDSIQCFVPASKNIGIVSYEGGGNVWIDFEKEAVKNGEDCIQLPSPSSWEFPTVIAGNKFHILADGSCFVAIYCT